eukprot:1158543-Pelagomonas_calceolata.AAC.2
MVLLSLTNSFRCQTHGLIALKGHTHSPGALPHSAHSGAWSPPRQRPLSACTNLRDGTAGTQHAAPEDSRVWEGTKRHEAHYPKTAGCENRGLKVGNLELRRQTTPENRRVWAGIMGFPDLSGSWGRAQEVGCLVRLW